MGLKQTFEYDRVKVNDPSPSAQTGMSVPDDARERLLEAAGPIFADRGFAATVREICLAAGVNVAGINYHFGDKERLYIEAVKRAHCNRMRAVAPPWDEDVTPTEKLRMFVCGMLQRMLHEDRDSWQSRLMQREMLDPTAACREIVEEYVRPLHNRLTEVLAAIEPGVTPTDLSRTTNSVIGQCLFYKIARPIVEIMHDADERERDFSPRVLADHITNLTVAGLRVLAGQRLGHALPPSCDDRVHIADLDATNLRDNASLSNSDAPSRPAILSDAAALTNHHPTANRSVASEEPRL